MINKVFYFSWSYDEIKDEYFAYVDDGSLHGETIYTIDNTQEVCDYIESGRMEHIDDYHGLEIFLKEQGHIGPNDMILFMENEW